MSYHYFDDVPTSTPAEDEVKITPDWFQLGLIVIGTQVVSELRAYGIRRVAKRFGKDLSWWDSQVIMSGIVIAGGLLNQGRRNDEKFFLQMKDEATKAIKGEKS